MYAIHVVMKGRPNLTPLDSIASLQSVPTIQSSSALLHPLHYHILFSSQDLPPTNEHSTQ